MGDRDTVILVTRKGMGHGPADLQLTLLEKYLQLLNESSDLPSAICFYTDGVKLLTEPSPVLDQLMALEQKRVRLIVCTTCLNYFKVMDELKVGIAGSMADILAAQLNAAKVISL